MINPCILLFKEGRWHSNSSSNHAAKEAHFYLSTIFLYPSSNPRIEHSISALAGFPYGEAFSLHITVFRCMITKRGVWLGWTWQKSYGSHQRKMGTGLFIYSYSLFYFQIPISLFLFVIILSAFLSFDLDVKRTRKSYSFLGFHLFAFGLEFVVFIDWCCCLHEYN